MQGNPQTAVKVVNHVAPAQHTAAPTPSGIDCKGWREALIIFPAGTFTGDESATVVVHDSADNSSFAAITSPSTAAFSAVTSTNDDTLYLGRLNLEQIRRYIKVVVTSSGTGNAPYAVTVVLMQPNETSRANDTYAFNVDDH